MRLSIDKRDPGYRFDILKLNALIYFNDQLFTRCVTADEEQGLIVAYVVGEDGKFCTNSECTCVLTEILCGRVRIDIISKDGEGLSVPKVVAERNDSHSVTLLVYSRNKPGNIRRILIENKDYPDAQIMAIACEVFAGAAAEYLCEHHGDIFDPAEVAAAGIDALKKLLAREGAATRH